MSEPPERIPSKPSEKAQAASPSTVPPPVAASPPSGQSPQPVPPTGPPGAVTPSPGTESTSGGNGDPAGPPRSESPPPASRRQWAFREPITALLGVGIAAVALFMLVKAFLDGPWVSSEYLEPALGLLGTVTGYFFGRAPAERRADTAELNTVRAEQRTQQATVEAEAANSRAGAADERRVEADRALETAKRTLLRVERHLSRVPRVTPGTLAQPGAAPSVDQVTLALEDLSDLRQRLP